METPIATLFLGFSVAKLNQLSDRIADCLGLSLDTAEKHRPKELN